MAHSLPKLPYAYDALEPNISAMTLEIHPSSHHSTFTTNLNNALEGTGFEDVPIEELVTNLDHVPEKKRQAVINNGGVQPQGDVAKAIDAELGGLDAFKDAFKNAALSRFSSGWGLSVTPKKSWW